MPRDRRRHRATNWSSRALLSRVRARRLAAASADRLPQEILDDMETSEVSIFAVQVQRNELKSRMQMTDVVNRRKIRHAHMVNINRQIMLEGMRADFSKVDRISQKVVEMVRKAKQIRANDPGGHRSGRRSESRLQVAQDQRHHQSATNGATCPAAKSSPRPAK